MRVKLLGASLAVLASLLPFSQHANAAQKVVGYSTSWTGEAATIPMAKLTHVNYAFIVPFGDGHVQAIPNPEKLTQLVAAAHPLGKKVLISVGGWNNGDDSGFELLAGNPASRANFVNTMLSVVNVYTLDGVDIDWEYPDFSGSSGDNFSVLMQELCAALHAEGKLCTAAVSADSRNGSGVHVDVFGFVDFLNLMAYDGGSGPDHSPYTMAVGALDYWLGRGLPPAKAVLGLPFYGRPTWEAYSAIVARDPQAPSKDVSNGVFYNGIDTIKAKTTLAMQRAGGVMIWELSQDTSDDQTSLLTAIWSLIGPAAATGRPLK